MPLEYWMCHGIGVASDDVTPLVDPQKLVRLLELKCIGTVADDELLKDGSAFLALAEERQIDFLAQYVNEDMGLAGIIALADEEGILSTCCDDEGINYLLYTPRYPWDNQGSFLSRDSLEAYIGSLVHNYCHDGVTIDWVQGFVREHYEISTN